MATSLRTLDAIRLFRHAVVDLLKTANIDGIGNNVFEARMENAWPEETGLLVVYTSSTEFDDKRTSPRFYSADTTVEIDVVSQGEEDSTNDFLDNVSKAIVEALQPVEKRVGPFNGTVKRFVLKSFRNSLSGKGEIDRGTQRITFSAEWTCCVTNGGPTDNFLTGKTKITMGDGEGNEQEFETKVGT